MNYPRITILGSVERSLRDHLTSHPEGHERAAIVLFRRLDRTVEGLQPSPRLLAIDVIPFDEEWITSSSPTKVAFKLSPLRENFRRCEEEGLVFGFAHSHPGGQAKFSIDDDSNERELLRAVTNRNGRSSELVALVVADNRWAARVWRAEEPDEAIPVRHVSVLGSGMTVFVQNSHSSEKTELLARQEAAFGKPFVETLRSLRIGVVGAGGTGSATATLLARAGVAELIIFDKDLLESTNLNRVKGARYADVGKNKAEVLGDFIDSLGLPARVATVSSFLDDSPESVDALSTCDVVFGCTDDQLGRRTLNTALYYYGFALIDVGLGGWISCDLAGNALLGGHHGRISTVLPEYGDCLFCQNVLRDELIRRQTALRDNPVLGQEEAKERYLEGGAEGAPGVGPFTSATADFGVATLFDLIRPYRKWPSELRRDNFSIDFVKMDFCSVHANGPSDCMYCKERYFVLRKETFRLGMPALGRLNV